MAGLISTLLPDNFFSQHLGSGVPALLVMLVVGVPLYICASASTPIAAALILKGVSPGAALVFLLAGPATNAATITIVLRYWGRKATALYLLSIALCALGFGWLVDHLYRWADLDISRWLHVPSPEPHGPAATGAAILLLLLIGRCLFIKRGVAKPGKSCS